MTMMVVRLREIRGKDPNAVIGRVRFDGTTITADGLVAERIIKHPAGLTKLVQPSEGAAYLQALVDQYSGTGLRAEWETK